MFKKSGWWLPFIQESRFFLNYLYFKEQIVTLILSSGLQNLPLYCNTQYANLQLKTISHVQKLSFNFN